MSESGTTPRRIALNYDLLSGLALVLIGAGAFFHGPGWGPRAWVFPNLVTWLMVALGTWLTIAGIRSRARERLFESWRAAVDVAWFSASVLVFFVLVPRMGYLLATWLFMSFQALILGGRRRFVPIVLTILVSGVVAFALYQLFSGAFNVRLPEGPLG